MPVRFTSHLLFSLLLMSSMPAGTAGLDDADARLFQVQLALAEKGDTRAQYYLGEMHEQGLGTKQNVNEAFKWYAKAAERGDAWAKRKLAHRAEIESDLKKEQTAEILKAAPAPVTPKNPGNAVKNTATKAKAPVVVAQTDESARDEEKIKAAEREKRRAAVRAMILDRIRNPVGDPFE